MKGEQPNSLGIFQLLTTILALLLPILQFFFKFAIDEGDGLFLFKDYFIATSIIAATLSYVFIIAYNNMYYFEIPIVPKRHRKYRQFLNNTNSSYFDAEHIRDYVNKNGVVDRPFYFNNHNIHTPISLMLAFAFCLFLYLGLMYSDTENVSKSIIFAQIITYIISVALLTMALAVFYINQSNRNRYERAESRRFKKLLGIAFDNQAIDEFPNISFIAQEPLPSGDYLTLLKSNETYYKMVTDGDIRRIKLVERYNKLDDLYASLANNMQG